MPFHGGRGCYDLLGLTLVICSDCGSSAWAISALVRQALSATGASRRNTGKLTNQPHSSPGVELAAAWSKHEPMAVILFVEDDRPSRRNIARFLRLSGYEVYEAEDGEAALSLLSRMQFDVVISDLNLPGEISGIDILAGLKKIPREIDGILVTGRGSDEIKTRADSLGAAYMEKPLQLRELEKAIQHTARS